MISYPVEFDEHTGFAVTVTVRAVGESGTILQYGAVELTGAFGVVANLAAVLLNEVLIGGAGVIIFHLLTVIIRYTTKHKHLEHSSKRNLHLFRF